MQLQPQPADVPTNGHATPRRKNTIVTYVFPGLQKTIFAQQTRQAHFRTRRGPVVTSLALAISYSSNLLDNPA